MKRDAAWLMMPLVLQAEAAWAMPDALEADPAQQCRAAIAATERVTRIPDEFLNAISRVESGRPEGETINPWPWTVNAAGTGHFYATKAEAIAAVRRFQASGIKSLDVGCMQVNLFYHQDAFSDLDQAFDPAVNAAYAGKLLMALFQQTGSWPRAAAAYHSMTPALGEAYQKKVLEAWATPDRPVAGPRSRPRPGQPAAEQHAHTPVLAATSAGRALAVPSLAMAPPTLGFTRRFTLTPHSGGVGRSLAEYRAATIRVAIHAPEMQGLAGAVRPGL